MIGFSVSGLKCYPGYSGTVNAKVCSAHDTAYSVSGCNICPAGKFQNINSVNNNQCKYCPIGYFQGSKGQSSCTLCPRGMFQKNVGKETCDNCPLGKYTKSSNGGQSQCDTCVAGKVAEDRLASECNDCESGLHQPLAEANLWSVGRCIRCKCCDEGIYRICSHSYGYNGAGGVAVDEFDAEWLDTSPEKGTNHGGMGRRRRKSQVNRKTRVAPQKSFRKRRESVEVKKLDINKHLGKIAKKKHLRGIKLLRNTARLMTGSFTRVEDSIRKKYEANRNRIRRHFRFAVKHSSLHKSFKEGEALAARNVSDTLMHFDHLVSSFNAFARICLTN